MSQSSIVVLLFGLRFPWLARTIYIVRVCIYNLSGFPGGNRPAGVNAGAKQSLYWRTVWEGDGYMYVGMYVFMYIQTLLGIHMCYGVLKLYYHREVANGRNDMV